MAECSQGPCSPDETWVMYDGGVGVVRDDKEALSGKQPNKDFIMLNSVAVLIRGAVGPPKMLS